MSAPASHSRLTALDALRGLIMVIMALDHTRDFIHAGAMSFSPEDLTRTTPIIFLTRWVTHICAPVFMCSAGAGAFLRLQRPGTTRRELSWFLCTRGLALIVIELVVMRVAMNFSLLTPYPLLLLVLWALGLSMIVLAALIHLPRRVLLAGSIAVILLHNTLDGVPAASFGALSGVWNVLHQPGVFFLGGIPVVAAYPLVPWFAVMALGFACGPVFLLPAGGSPARVPQVGRAPACGLLRAARGQHLRRSIARGRRSRPQSSPSCRSCARRSIRPRSSSC